MQKKGQRGNEDIVKLYISLILARFASRFSESLEFSGTIGLALNREDYTNILNCIVAYNATFRLFKVGI